MMFAITAWLCISIKFCGLLGMPLFLLKMRQKQRPFINDIFILEGVKKIVFRNVAF